MKRCVLLSLALIVVSCASAQVDDLRAAIAAKHPILVADEWGGGRRSIFDFGGRRAWVVEPPALDILNGLKAART